MGKGIKEWLIQQKIRNYCGIAGKFNQKNGLKKKKSKEI